MKENKIRKLLAKEILELCNKEIENDPGLQPKFIHLDNNEFFEFRLVLAIINHDITALSYDVGRCLMNYDIKKKDVPDVAKQIFENNKKDYIDLKFQMENYLKADMYFCKKDYQIIHAYLDLYESLKTAAEAGHKTMIILFDDSVEYFAGIFEIQKVLDKFKSNHFVEIRKEDCIESYNLSQRDYDYDFCYDGYFYPESIKSIFVKGNIIYKRQKCFEEEA